jgi:uncharacterized protein YndB with AHSA1/START domain
MPLLKPTLIPTRPNHLPHPTPNKEHDMSTRSSEHATFALSRTYPVAPDRVFAAWSSQEAKARWFGSTDDNAYSLDFRIGGTETNRGGPPDGPVYRFIATYHEIVPDERIVYGSTMDADDTRVSVSVTTVELVPEGDGSTTLTFTEQGVFLDGHDTADQREGGTADLLDALGRSLA